MKYEYNNHLITQGKSIYKKVIGFIMDGNRRWAKLNSKTLTEAYSQGTHILNMTILACITYKINTVIFYALSLENFTKRSKDEINVIQNIGLKQLNENKEYFIKNKIKIQFIGNKKANKDEESYYLIKEIEKKTKTENPLITIFILFIYDPFKDVFHHSNKKKLLYSNDIPNVDLIIRTGGHNRLSGFLPIQSLNANIVTLDDLWPDLTKEKLYSIFSTYKNNQNYGQ